MNDSKDSSRSPAPPAASQPQKEISPLKDASRYEKYATTQAAADGREGDTRKKAKTEEEKLGDQMTDRR